MKFLRLSHPPPLSPCGLPPAFRGHLMEIRELCRPVPGFLLNTNTHERTHAGGFQRDPTRPVWVFNSSLFSLCFSSKVNAPDIPLHILLYSSSSSLYLYSCFSVSLFSCVPDVSLINTLVMNYIVDLTGEPTRAQ